MTEHTDGNETHLQIGAVAERTELSIRTIRHYDDVGLVTPSERSSGGFRLYTEHDVQRLLVIRRMKPLGFTLDEMKRLLESLRIIDSPAPGDDIESARTFVGHCHAHTQDSCTKLRKQVSYAKELTELLAEHVDGTRSRVVQRSITS